MYNNFIPERKLYVIAVLNFDLGKTKNNIQLLLTLSTKERSEPT